MNNQLSTTNQSLAISQPSPVDRAAMQNLLPVEKKMIEAALQPKINEQPALDVVNIFVSIVTTAYTRAGYKMPDIDTLALYADEFYTSLLEKFPRVSIPEVREALKEGVYGEYGEFTGLNPKTFMQFIKGYIASNTRKEAVKQFESKKLFLIAQRELTPDERDKYNKDFVNDLFADHIKGTLVADYVPSFIYDVLENLGKIKLTLDEKRKINERAKSYFTRLKTSKRYKGSANRIGDELTAFIQTRDEEITIKTISKQFAVVDFFEEMVKAGSKTIFPNPKLLQ
jgi:hypothetical protein